MLNVTQAARPTLRCVWHVLVYLILHLVLNLKIVAEKYKLCLCVRFQTKCGLAVRTNCFYVKRCFIIYISRFTFSKSISYIFVRLLFLANQNARIVISRVTKMIRPIRSRVSYFSRVRKTIRPIRSDALLFSVAAKKFLSVATFLHYEQFKLFVTEN